MSRKSLGYTKLEWICPRCKSRNPGPQKTCLACGAPQPADIKFEKSEKPEILKEQKDIEQAKKGADIHCAFCGARNPAGTEVCSQCGADLVHGERREVGQVIGAYTEQPLKETTCPNCGQKNPIDAYKCANCGATLAKADIPTISVPTNSERTKPKYLLIGVFGLVIALILCIAVFSLFGSRTEDIIGTVQNVSWMTSVMIEQLQPVTRSSWTENIPTGADIQSCSLKYHHTQDTPTENSVEICGTPYQVDLGQGYAEAVQDCQYEVYQDYCEYVTLDWQQIDNITLQGNDNLPAWPDYQVAQDQRLGAERQSYQIIFETEGGQFTYETDNYELFQQCQPGSKWLLTINSFNQVVSIEPSS